MMEELMETLKRLLEEHDTVRGPARKQMVRTYRWLEKKSKDGKFLDSRIYLW